MKNLNYKRGASKSHHGVYYGKYPRSLNNSFDFPSTDEIKCQLPEFFYGQLHHLEPFEGDLERPNYIDPNEFDLTTEEENIIDFEDETMEK